MFMERRKLEIPKMEKKTTSGKRRQAIVFDNWQNNLRDKQEVIGLDWTFKDAVMWLG